MTKGKRGKEGKEDKELNVQVGKRLLDYRTGFKYTQKEMADLLDITYNYYGLIERGKRGLSIYKIISISEILEIDPTYLLTGEKASQYQLNDFIENASVEKRECVDRILEYVKKLVEME